MSSKVPAGNIRLKRAYDDPAPDDGTRILVDRLWPRGIKKEAAAVDQWLRDIAPSTELRKWFGHEPERWPEFQRRYAAELKPHAELLAGLRDTARHGIVTLLYSAHDEEHNNAVALRHMLLGD